MELNKQGVVRKVSGPLVVAEGMGDCHMYDVARVGDKHLIGEIIELRGDVASIQVYEDTAGLGPGEAVFKTEEPLSVELGPGLIGGIYDGIQRPLETIYELAGDRITRGIERIDRLNSEYGDGCGGGIRAGKQAIYAMFDEAHERLTPGGTLTIGNAPGGGTLVSVRLPFAAESST